MARLDGRITPARICSCHFGYGIAQRDETAFPVRTFSSGRFIAATKTLVVNLCANQQDKVRPIKAVEHPAWPAFRRGPYNVLIDLSVDAIDAKPFGQCEY